MKGLNDKYTRVVGGSEQAELASIFDTVPIVLRQNAGSLEVVRFGAPGDTRADIPEGHQNGKRSLEYGDRIVSIQGVSVAGMSVSTAADLLESLPGPITLEFTTGDSGARQLTTITGRHEGADVEFRSRRIRGVQVGYLRISRFSAGVSARVADAITGAPPLDVWVLDLRGNSGGLVREAQRVAGAFLGEEGVLVDVSSKGSRDGAEAELPALLPREWGDAEQARANVVGDDKGVIVVVDESSASASEFLAVALEEGRGATIAGKQSRGKALIQGLFPLEDPDTAVIVTTGLVAAPLSKCSWQGAGLTPQVALSFLPPARLPLTLSLPGLPRLIEAVDADAMPGDSRPSLGATQFSACAGDGGVSSIASGETAWEEEEGGQSLQVIFRCPAYWACGWEIDGL